MIRIENITKRFKKLTALDDLSVSFSDGQVISLIGPNGSGKTTLIKCILNLVKPDSGKIYVGETLVGHDPSYRQQIGYMPQIGRYPDNMKVGQLFRMLKNIRNASDQELDTDLLNSFRLKDIFEKPMRTLSGGTRQKVSAALAFYFNSPILVLDEPTAGLDPLASEILKEKILAEKTRNKLILITSHILSDLDELTTHVMYIQDGKMKFIKALETIREETGETRLGKAIARIMKGDPLIQPWTDHTLVPEKNEKLYKEER